MAKTDFRTALAQTNEIELGTTGRVSGQETTRPVWFVEHDDTLFLLPVTGSDSQWYKNVLVSPAIHITAGSADVRLDGTPITDENTVGGVVDDFREKYGADVVAEWYPNPNVAVRAELS
jgi:hypothetical protein